MKTSIFEEVTVSWGGKDYRIPPREMLGAIASVEDHVTLGELHRWQARGVIPYAKVARAYSALLRYAGCEITPDEVYDELFSSEKKMEIAAHAITTLMLLMVPPAKLREAEAKDDSAKKDAGGAATEKKD